MLKIDKKKHNWLKMTSNTAKKQSERASSRVLTRIVSSPLIAQQKVKATCLIGTSGATWALTIEKCNKR